MPDFEQSPLSRRDWLGAISIASLGTGALALPRASAADTSRPSENDLGARMYNIRDFGAKGDGKTLDTAALQAAIDACHKDQGGIVLVPAGVFVIGTTELKSNVTLRIAAQGKLLGVADGKQYHPANEIPLSGDSTLGDGNTGLLYAVNADNITVEGPGTIDGQGEQFRGPTRGAPSPAGISGSKRPYHLLFHRCNNLTVRDIFLKDSAFHSVRIIQSNYVQLHGIHIHGRVISNNDGFHFISSQYVNMSNCNVEAQDDACALFGSCKFVMVTNCSFSTRWSVFRFGGGEAENITVSNCIIYECYGCPVKMRCGPGSRFENIQFSNIVMKDVTGPISIGNGPRARRQTAQGETQALSTALASRDTNAAVESAPGASKNLLSPALPSKTAGGETPATKPVNPAANADVTAPVPPPPRPGIVRNISFNGLHVTVTKPVHLRGATWSSTYNPGEIFSCITLNAFDETFLDNISFNDVHITFPGGGTREHGAVRDVPKVAGEYYSMGIPPAYAIFARNVRGLTMQNVRFDSAEPDLRPAMVFDHVTDANVIGLAVRAEREAESALRIIDSQDVLLSATRLLNSADVFLQVEGQNSRGITVDGGDISKAGKQLAFSNGATEKGVRHRI
jgi:hypothetical protein